MPPKLFFCFCFFILFVNVCTQELSEKEERKAANRKRFNYLLEFSVVVFSSSLRYLSVVFNIRFPPGFFQILLGILWGVGGIYLKWIRTYTSVSYMTLTILFEFYFRIYLFSLGFCCDTNAFLRSWLPVIVISIPVALATALFTAFLAECLIFSYNNWTYAMLFSTALMPISANQIIRYLPETTIQNKYIVNLIEGEAIVSTTFTLFLHKFICKQFDGWLVEWYQFVMGLVRDLLLILPVCYCFGRLGTYLMKMAYNDVVGIMVITLGMALHITMVLPWLMGSGVWCSTVVGLLMGAEKASLSKEMEGLITNFWKNAREILSGIICVHIGALMSQIFSSYKFDIYMLILANFLIINLARFLCFLLFSPLLSRIGSGMTFSTMSMCVWGVLRNPVLVCLALHMYANQQMGDLARGETMFLHLTSLYLLTTIINGAAVPLLIKVFGLNELTSSKLINMNNCFKFISEARKRTISILKMDRFFADANWALVLRTTTIEHPYKKLRLAEDDEEEEYSTKQFTRCPDCDNAIINEPTRKEMKEMTREVKLRLLKLKKAAHIRQRENGMISAQGCRLLLHAVDVAIDSPELAIELEGLFKMFHRKAVFPQILKSLLLDFMKPPMSYWLPPRKTVRMWLYRLLNHDIYGAVMNFIMFFHFVLLTFHIATEKNFSVLVCAEATFLITYILQYILKVYTISEDSFKGAWNYFKSIWNILQFLLIAITSITFLYHLSILNKRDVDVDYILDVINASFLLLQTVHSLSLLRHCACCKNCLTSFTKCLDRRTVRCKALAYELTKNYIAAEEEILENLHQTVNNEEIREVVKQKIVADRLEATRHLGIAQKEYPEVALTVKTKAVMSTVLNSMKTEVVYLKGAGWMDDLESSKLLKSLGRNGKFIKSLDTIQVTSSKQLFQELPFMGNDVEIIDFLYSHVVQKKFVPKQVVFNKGDVARCIFIVISGMFLESYSPKLEFLDQCQTTGAIPVTDIHSLNFYEPMSEYIVPGNTIGELAFVTKRPYNCLVTAAINSQAYMLNEKVLMEAFDKDCDPVNGMECRMWKALSFKKALTVLSKISAYRSFTQDQIKYYLERSFVPNLTNYKNFVVNNMMHDIILIDGMVLDMNSKQYFKAPCYIPRTVRTLVLSRTRSRSSHLDITTEVEPKLLIIPAKDFNEYEVMIVEEDHGDLIDPNSPLCLRNIVLNKKLEVSQTVTTIAKLMTGVKRKLTDSRTSMRSNRASQFSASFASKNSSIVTL